MNLGSLLMGLFGKSTAMVNAASALPGRNMAMPVPATHYETVIASCRRFRTACNWRSLRWAASGAPSGVLGAAGVYSTALGYAGGYTPNPTYQEVCSGANRAHGMVLVVYDPARTRSAMANC